MGENLLHLAMFFSLFFFFLFFFHVHGNAELEALMEIKASLDPQNLVLSSWTKYRDPCDGSFEGVACNENRKVANISLQGKGLSGKVSPALAELKCLSGLYLHYNNLSGEIPIEISNLTELTDLYLNVNALSGNIPSRIPNMASLQVLQLCCNKLSGKIPSEIGSSKKLNVVSLQYNKLSGLIPKTLSNLKALKRLDLSFNNLNGPIPRGLSTIQSLQALDVSNNSLSGTVPNGLRRLKDGFQFENNPLLCGFGFSHLRPCTTFDLDKVNLDHDEDSDPSQNPESADPHSTLRHESKKLGRLSATSAAVTVVAVTVVVSTVAMVFATIVRHRRGKQKVGNSSEPSEFAERPGNYYYNNNNDNDKEFRSRSASPLVSLEYSNKWDPLSDHNLLNAHAFNVEEIEKATNCLSEANILGRSKFSAVYRGVLRDGSEVAIRRISVTSCKSDESEFARGLELLFSMRHENLVRMRGFCCSKSRNECFLVYDFACRGKLSGFLEMQENNETQLDWPKRVSIVTGIARGIQYLHSNEPNKGPMVHQNISTEKVLIDQNFKPLISDSGLPKLLADDIIFSALKTSAAMGYLAPEYITTGRFTQESDIYAFGVIVLQLVSGQLVLSNSIRTAAKSSNFDGFLDPNLRGEFSKTEASLLGKLALSCTNEVPEERPSIEEVIQLLN